MKRNTARTPNPVEEVKLALGRVLQLNALVSRSSLLSGLGKSYGGDRDLYTALGYKLEPSYTDYVNVASRDGFGKRVNEAPCDAVWSKPPAIIDSMEQEESEFEVSFQKLVRKFKLWSRFNRLDKLLGFGPYAVLLLGFDDADLSTYRNPVAKKAELVYMQCYSSEYARIKQLENDPHNPRYGLPRLYTISALDPDTLSAIGTQIAPDQEGRTFDVHYSRILHVLEGNLTNEIIGEPRLKVCYNRLQDIEKVVGGAAEMFWRGARPGYVAKLDDDFNWDPDGNDPSLKAMKAQIQEYENNLRRILTLRGVSMEGMDMQLAVDPIKYLDMQIQDLSAATGIPKRLLTGSERGELASTQDRDAWFDFISNRRDWFASPVIVEPFVDMMIDRGVVPAPKNGEYHVLWPDLKAQSEKDRADIGRTRSVALKNYLTAPDADQVVPPETFLMKFLGMDESTAADMVTQLRAYLGDALQQEGTSIASTGD